ncbi:hypothetical protein X293_06635 [Oenococcus oeni IOEB_C52]|nr:hypothetical protein X293_06635 [Oenococcus oeni IOEB_C52]
MLKIMKECAQVMFLFSLCFKNHLIYQEEEIRFVVSKINDKDNTLYPEKIVNNKPRVSYNFKPNLLKNVILSHKINQPKEHIRAILDQNGFTDTQIEETQLPY